MIFGFNTDVKHGNTVYHVQTEALQSSHLFQSTVFVQGRVLGKTTSSYAAHVGEPDFSEQKMHDLLKDQHRRVLEAIKHGRIESVLSTAASN